MDPTWRHARVLRAEWPEGRLRSLRALQALGSSVCALAAVFRTDSLPIGAVALVVVDLPVFRRNRVVGTRGRHVDPLPRTSRRRPSVASGPDPRADGPRPQRGESLSVPRTVERPIGSLASTVIVQKSAHKMVDIESEIFSRSMAGDRTRWRSDPRRGFGRPLPGDRVEVHNSKRRVHVGQLHAETPAATAKSLGPECNPGQALVQESGLRRVPPHRRYRSRARRSLVSGSIDVTPTSPSPTSLASNDWLQARARPLGRPGWNSPLDRHRATCRAEDARRGGLIARAQHFAPIVDNANLTRRTQGRRRGPGQLGSRRPRFQFGNGFAGRKPCQ